MRVHANAGVVYQPKGRTELLNPREICADNPPGVQDICFRLEEGYRVRTVPEAGYGPVASIVLPDSTQIDLRAHPTGTDITLVKYQVTRWNNQRQEVVFRQDAGYARYDVHQGQAYADVSYTVEVADGIRVQPAPGGSYSINVPRDSGDFPVLTQAGTKMRVEVAVRSGQAEIDGPNQHTTIGPGKAGAGRSGRGVERPAAGALGADPRWRFLAAHRRGLYEGQQHVVGDRHIPPAGRRAARACFRSSAAATRTPDLCPLPADRTSIGQFRREGGTRGQYITSIMQVLDLDVSGYRQIQFGAWTRVLTQTIEGAGIDGTECPLMIMLEYRNTSPSDELLWSRTCVYTGAEAPVKQDYLQYVNIERFEWEHLQLDLRAIPDLKSARYLRQIIIEARGHDYLAEITGISLMGSE